MTATRDALADLQWHWGQAYKITGNEQQWIAERRDNRRILIASGPNGLRELIITDYTAEPVARDGARGGLMTGPLIPPGSAAYVQAAALRTAFPQYIVNVAARRGGKPRFEVVSRNGGNPYCLISEDAHEIWQELRAAS
jgi:hypothetical protein